MMDEKTRICPTCGNKMEKTKVNFNGPPISSATFHLDLVWKCPVCETILKW
jgi:RNA polymerase subunit RPABC4/transcription elongation factor Spt4